MENILMYTTIALGIFVIILFILVIMLMRRIKKITAGKTMQSLESIIIENNALSKNNESMHNQHSTDIENIKKELKNTIKNISVVRFDALGDSGGMQSFAIGLTDAHQNGVVVSSMYTRDRMNVFAKEITAGESKHTLTEEERKAINH